MIVAKAYRYRLQPTQGQKKKMARSAGVARYAWNWLLALVERESAAVKAAREALTEEQRAEFDRVNKLRGAKRKTALENAEPWLLACMYPSTHYARLYKEICRHRDTEAPWMGEVHSHCYSNAAKRLSAALDRWMKKKGGHPRFHGRNHVSFTIQISQRNLRRRSIRVPGVGWVRVVNEDVVGRIPPTAKIAQVTCRQQAGRWEGSVTAAEVEISDPPRRIGPVVGVDLGVNAICTIARSDRTGRTEVVSPPRPLETALRRLAALQRRFAFAQHELWCRECDYREGLDPKTPRGARRRVCDCGGKLRRRLSKRGHRLRMRIARLHDRVAQIRANHLHQLSHRLTGPEFGARMIVTEGHDVTDLVSRGVARTRKGKRKRTRRREMLDLGWGELRRQLAYKSTWRGVEYVETDSGAPTDATCHVCGAENKMPDSTSEYVCSSCGLDTTRQVNTAWLLVGYGSGREPWSTGGDPGPDGREPARDGTEALEPPAGGVNGCMTTLPRGAFEPPGGSRKRRKARKAGGKPRRKARAKKAQGGAE